MSAYDNTEILGAAMRFFYLQRCGCELDAERAGKYAHPACHTSFARVLGTNERIDVHGGWHDAGDYGRYIVPAAKAVADLLLARRAAPAVFLENQNTELLDEVRYELEWMLRMQREDGGVYAKVSCAGFCGFVMPEKETAELVVCPVSTPATADFAACMAMAYTDYMRRDPGFAESCLLAADRAWSFLEKQGFIGFLNPSGVVTGEYGDGENPTDEDERFFAAAALFEATGRGKYHAYVKEHAQNMGSCALGWGDMSGYGGAVYLSLSHELTDKATRAMLGDALCKKADVLVERAKTDPWGVSLDEYTWGSNMYLLNNAMTLLMANDVRPNPAYVSFARRHIAYIFGVNPLHRSYFTGFGDTPPRHPHHRPSAAAGEAMPGMVVGGPDAGLHDECAKRLCANKPPCECYVDEQDSYSTNEVCIYWNSPLVYVLARLM